ncbi:MAG: D-glycero-beta-D-manno-heptose 1-phosphate adenylyltransferase [Phycisphaera sp.]|nr:D-glycero-beta-D-manno-heptose 1-phosphate adenylyltransferase [Phycisphaera sp.]
MAVKKNQSLPPLPKADELIRFVDKWSARQRRHVVVLGDYMLDRYTYGNAERLSPDAPVPVLAGEKTDDRPGGAANVCLDLRALHCDVSCLGVVGNDANGKVLKGSLKKTGCDVSGMVASPDRPTTVKHSFIGLAQHRHPQKMFRVDAEKKSPIPAAIETAVLAQAMRLLRTADALCIEDYNKGVVSPALSQGVIKAARKLGVPVLVDPAAISDYSKYTGATTITPNRTEAALATGRPYSDASDANLHAMAKDLLTRLKLDNVVLTLDKQGALLLEKQQKPLLVPTVARQVYDVTGAGDMVLAMLAAAVAQGAAWPMAVDLANTAAGLEVEKFGVVPIELDEVLLSLLHRRHEELGKARTLEQLLPELQAHRRQGKKIAFTNGCFDILHAGHVQYLREARRTGDLLVVGLNSDSSIRNLKGPDRPVNHEADRVMVLSELQSVDYVVVFGEQTPIKLIRAIKPDTLVKGADYKKSQVVGADIVEKHGGRVVLVDLVQGRSTTNIIGKIQMQKRG